jgi:hypothetical protein
MTVALSGDVIEKYQAVGLGTGDWCDLGTEYIGLNIKFI